MMKRVGVANAGGKAPAQPVNLSRWNARRPATIIPDRRGTWFVTTLIGCGAIALVGGAVLLATQGNNAAATVPVRVELRPLSTTSDSLSGLGTPLHASLGGAPTLTGAITADGEALDTPELRRLTEDGRAANPAVERAAAMAIQAATYGLTDRQSAVDRPMVLGDAPGLRLASLGTPTNMTILVKRPPTDLLPPQHDYAVVVSDGDTFYSILERYGVAMSDAVAVARAMSDLFPPQDLRAGQEMVLSLRDDGDDRMVPLAVIMLAGKRNVAVLRDGDGTYVARASGAADEERTHHRALASIEGSLYGSARSKGVPDSIIVRMMRNHSYDVDFQREIKAGDQFEVFYASGDGADDGPNSSAEILFSSLTAKGETHGYYRFTSEDGTADYYDATGLSSRKPLMKTPINGARISSGFGMRRHPILGYTKLHGGTDFAAPTGTPVLAAGDGTVEVAGRNGGYGNYIRLKHKDGVKTAYAHLSRFAKGIAPGKSVHQGDVIGFVGSTGQSTGPHLHYEVLVNGKKENPLTVQVAGGGRKLEGEELARFLEERDRIDAIRIETPSEALVAAAQP